MPKDDTPTAVEVSQCLKSESSASKVLKLLRTKQSAQRISLSNANTMIGCTLTVQKEILFAIKNLGAKVHELELISIPLSHAFSHFVAILEKLTNLRSLKLVDNGLTDEFFLLLPDRMRIGKLATLNLESQSFGEKSPALVQRFLAPQNGLVTLKLSSCRLSGAATNAVFRSVKGFAALKNLSVVDGDLRLLGDSIAASLSTLGKLQNLSLSACRINNDLAAVILRSLRTQSNIVAIDLSGNDIVENGVEKLFHLIDNTTATMVDFSDNPMVQGPYAEETRAMLKMTASSTAETACVRFINHKKPLTSASQVPWRSIQDVIEDPTISSFDSVQMHTEAVLQFLNRNRHCDLKTYVRLFLRYCRVFVEDRPSADRMPSVEIAQRNYHSWKEFVHISELIFFTMTRHLLTARWSCVPMPSFSEIIYQELRSLNDPHSTSVLAVARSVLQMLFSRKWFPKLGPQIQEVISDINFIALKQEQGF